VQNGTVIKRPERKEGEPKGRRPDQDVIEALFRLRELGIVPWDWIVDETRHFTKWRYASTVADYLADTVKWARIDLWGVSRRRRSLPRADRSPAP
jgi:hypothetical protein